MIIVWIALSALFYVAGLWWIMRRITRMFVPQKSEQGTREEKPEAPQPSAKEIATVKHYALGRQTPESAGSDRPVSTDDDRAIFASRTEQKPLEKEAPQAVEQPGQRTMQWADEDFADPQSLRGMETPIADLIDEYSIREQIDRQKEMIARQQAAEMALLTEDEERQLEKFNAQDYQ